MTDLGKDVVQTSPPDVRPDPHILDYFVLMMRYKWLVVALVIVGGVVFTGLGYVMPYEYQSDSLLLPPDRPSSAGLLPGYIGGYALTILKEVENPSVDLLQNIVESRTLAEIVSRDPVVHSYFLHSAHTEEEFSTAVHNSLLFLPLISRARVRGTVETGWFSTAAEKIRANALSSYLSNRAIVVMDSLLRAEFKSSSHIARLYADSDYVARSHELDSLAVEESRMQSEYGVVSLKEQAKEMVSHLSELEAEKEERRMTLDLLSRDLSPEDTRYRMAKAQFESAEQAAEDYRSHVLTGASLSEFPDVSRQYLSLVERRTTLEAIVSYLRKEQEQQRINEEREKSLITVVDIAKPADAPSSPHKVPMLLIGLSAGLVLSIIFIGLRTMFQSYGVLTASHPIALGRGV